MNDNIVTLDKLKLNRRAVILKISSAGKLKQKMIDLGFTEGTLVEALHSSPSGDPTAYSVKGTVIALRKEDAEKITAAYLNN